jgi:hypothetical protein
VVSQKLPRAKRKLMVKSTDQPSRLAQMNEHSVWDSSNLASTSPTSPAMDNSS